MKNKTNPIVIVIIALAFIIIKFSTFSFNRTSSEMSMWSTVVSDSTKKNTAFNKPYILVFKGLDDTIAPEKNNNNLKINVYVEKNTSLGLLRFLPVYKPISFESKVSYKWNWPSTEQNNHLQENETGEFNISGNYNVLGFSSTEKVENAINDLISKNIRSKIEKDIKERLTLNTDQG